MSPFSILLVIGCILLETCEHLAYRMAGWVTSQRLAWTSIGVGTHLLVLVVWFRLLTLVPLGIAMPLMGGSYLTTALAGRVLFGERVDRSRWLGITAIVSGLLLIGAHAP